MVNRVVLTAAAAVLLSSGPSFTDELPGASAPLGNGTVGSYTILGGEGVPQEIGVVFLAGALDGLPAEKNNVSRCFDRDGDGANSEHECEGDYQLTLPFAAVPGVDADVPFTFAMVNYNPKGHIPAAWSVPHFDIHFYSVPLADVEAIRVGSCDFFIDCDDQKRALMPVAAKYVHPDHIDVGAAVGLMGNHLIDSKTPELASPGSPFTHTWVFGAYEGRIIFHEVMATTDFLTATGDVCADIKQPQARETAGYYPTRYCFRRDTSDGTLRVYMADFVLQPAG